MEIELGIWGRKFAGTVSGKLLNPRNDFSFSLMKTVKSFVVALEVFLLRNWINFARRFFGELFL